eukprot:5903341-Pyramimonas_sp.AAC.1
MVQTVLLKSRLATLNVFRKQLGLVTMRLKRTSSVAQNVAVQCAKRHVLSHRRVGDSDSLFILQYIAPDSAIFSSYDPARFSH